MLNVKGYIVNYKNIALKIDNEWHAFLTCGNAIAGIRLLNG